MGTTVQTGDRVECGNCGTTWTDPDWDQVLPLERVPDLGDRLSPGSEVPYGECGECGALVYLVKESDSAAAIFGDFLRDDLAPGELEIIRLKAWDAVFDAYRGDLAILRDHVTDEVAKMSTAERLTWICSDVDHALFSKVLGFDPFKPEESEEDPRCRYEDCSEGHPVANEDEQVTCATCREELGLSRLEEESS